MRVGQTRLAERLEQVVDGVDLEGLQRELVVGRGEDDGRPGADQFEHVEPRQLAASARRAAARRARRR